MKPKCDNQDTKVVCIICGRTISSEMSFSNINHLHRQVAICSADCMIAYKSSTIRLILKNKLQK
jgi:hypothetical protein